MTLAPTEITLASSLNISIDEVGMALYNLRDAEDKLREGSAGLEEFYVPRASKGPLPDQVAMEYGQLCHSNRQRKQAKIEASDAYLAATRSLIDIVKVNTGELVRVEAMDVTSIEKVKFLPDGKNEILDTPEEIAGRLAYVRKGSDVWLDSKHKHFSLFFPHFVAHTLGANPYKRQVTFLDV